MPKQFGSCTLSAGALALLGCGAKPVADFVIVDVPVITTTTQAGEQRLSVDDAAFASCSDADWKTVETAPDTTTPIQAGTTVVIKPADVMTYDGYNFDQVLERALMNDLKGKQSLRCPDAGEAARTPALCDPSVRTGALVQPELKRDLCDPYWLDCISALETRAAQSEGNQGVSDFTSVMVPTDARYLPQLTADTVQRCRCGASDVDLEAAHDELLAAWVANEAAFTRTVSGDASLTVTNGAETWTSDPQDGASSDRNAGICGVWLVSDNVYASLLAPKDGGEDATSLLEDYCGGVPLPKGAELKSDADDDSSTAPADERAETTAKAPNLPLTMFAWEQEGAGYRRLGGVGDLTNAYVLPGIDHRSRACPKCRRAKSGDDQGQDSCAASSGAMQLFWSDDLRHRAAQQGTKVHVLVAECSPGARTQELGWQRACWHAELPPASLAAGQHTTITIKGITDQVQREPAAASE
ncbi:MAG: hypothetical protein RL071_1912 [Pseudomonadota bacterium]|jgi:hypothetical protein